MHTTDNGGNPIDSPSSSVTVTTPPNAAPTASAVAITGTAQVNVALSGGYTYADAESDAQGTSTFRWVRNTVNTGVGGGTDVATTLNYTAVAGDQGKYLYFCVTPVASAGTTTGTEVCSSATAAVAAANAAPTASAVAITGTAKVAVQLIGSYTYADADSDAQGTSTFNWYSGSASDGSNKGAISGATSTSYTAVTADIGKYLFFCVTPKAQTGTLTGVENCSVATAAVMQDATCGSAHASTPLVTSAPSGGSLCSTGTASSVTTGASAYTWTCAGANGGTDSGTCSASRGYTVTPSAGANGSISPSTPQVVAYNATTQFTVTPSSGYQVSASGCGGSLSGSTFTTGAITAACTVSASFGVQQSYSARSPTDTGIITTTVSGAGGECGFASRSYQQASSAGGTPPVGVTFPHGVLNFTTNTCATGGTLNVTITYPQALPTGTKFYKYGPATAGATTFTWYEHPATISQDRLSVSYSVTDGGQGDSSATPGVITDPAGAAEPAAIAAGVTSVPTLSEWGMIIMSSLMMLFGIAQVRRRQGTGL